MKKRARFATLCEQLAYTFEDDALLEQALTHRSAAKQHNERLEFLGDAVLGMIIGETLFNQFPTVAEGKLTRMRASLVKGETLADIGNKLFLGEVIRLGSGEMKSGGSRRASILADTVEAIIGAVYREGGFESAKTVVLKLFQSRIEKLNPDAHPKDSKTRLQEWLQARKLPLPEYKIVSTIGKDHNQTFVVSCMISNQTTPTEGKAQSRRRAEQNAAHSMLERLIDEPS